MAPASRTALAAVMVLALVTAIPGAMAEMTQCSAERPVCGPTEPPKPPGPAPPPAPPELTPEQQAALFAQLRAALSGPAPYAPVAPPPAPAAPVGAQARRGQSGVSRTGPPIATIQGVLSTKYGMVRPTNDITVPNDEGQGQGELIQMLTYLENPALRVGVDVIRGGVVGHISSQNMPPEFRNRSLINTYDCGRMLQQSYYGCDDGSCWSKRLWRWNPVQCGSWENLPARLTEAAITPDRIRTTAMPRNWGNQELLEDVFLSSDYSLRPDALAIEFAIRYFGAFDHARRTQEVPAFFVDRRLSVLALYDGPRPWTGDGLKFAMPGGVNEDFNPTERWAAYIEPTTGYGIGVFTPIAEGMTSYRVGRDSSIRASDTSYLALTARFPIPRNSTHSYRAYVAVGRVDEIRETFRKYAIVEGLARSNAPVAVGAGKALPPPAPLPASRRRKRVAAAAAAAVLARSRVAAASVEDSEFETPLGHRRGDY